MPADPNHGGLDEVAIARVASPVPIRDTTHPIFSLMRSTWTGASPRT